MLRLLFEPSLAHFCSNSLHVYILTNSRSAYITGLYTESLAGFWNVGRVVHLEIYQTDPARSGLPPQPQYRTQGYQMCVCVSDEGHSMAASSIHIGTA